MIGCDMPVRMGICGFEREEFKAKGLSASESTIQISQILMRSSMESISICNRALHASRVAEVIQLDYTWAFEDSVAANHWCWKQQCRPAIRVAGHITAAIFLTACLLILVTINFAVIPFLGLLAGIYFYCLRPFESKWRKRRAFEKRREQDLAIHWEFSSTGILAQSELGRSELVWRALHCLVETPEGFLLYVTPEIYHFLPMRSFCDFEMIEKFRELFHEVNIRYLKIR
jgi:YcxB-like protein